MSPPREKLGGFSFREQPKGFRGGFFPEEDALPLLVCFCVLGSARVCEGVKYTMKAGCRLGYRELPGVQKCNTWGSPFDRWRGGEKDSFQPLPGKKKTLREKPPGASGKGKRDGNLLQTRALSLAKNKAAAVVLKKAGVE